MQGMPDMRAVIAEGAAVSRVEVLSAVHGIAPRSDELLRLGTDVERGRVSRETYGGLLAEESANWLQLQEEAGIDLPEYARLDWQDLLRPIVKASNGFAPDIDNAPVTRWFETNTFYRKPTIVGRLALDHDLAQKAIGQPGDNISLLSPASFAVLCNDRFSDLPADRNVFQLYAELLHLLEGCGVKRVVFDDYATNQDQNTALEHIKTLSDWYSDLQLTLISQGEGPSPIPWQPIKNLHVSVEPSRLTQISQLPDYRRPDFEGAEIWHPIVDVDTTLRDELNVNNWNPHVISTLKPARLVLTNSVDFERLPLKYAQEKVKRLGEFTLNLGDYLGVLQ